MQGVKKVKYKYLIERNELGLMNMQLTLKQLLDKYKAEKINFYEDVCRHAYILEIEAEEVI